MGKRPIKTQFKNGYLNELRKEAKPLEKFEVGNNSFSTVVEKPKRRLLTQLDLSNLSIKLN